MMGYNNAVLPRLAWAFTIYNFPISFVGKLEAACTKYLKRWNGLVSAETPLLVPYIEEDENMA